MPRRRRSGGNSRVRIDHGASDAPAGARAAVLFVIRMEDEEDVQSLFERRVRCVPVLRHLEHHAQEVPGVGQLVVGIRVGQSLGMSIPERRQGRQLADEAQDLNLVLVRPL